MEVMATVLMVGLIGALAVVRLKKADQVRAELETRYAQRSTRNMHNEYQNQQHLQQQQYVEDAATSNSMWFE